MPQPSKSEIIADLAEEFVERHRQGQRPRVDEYVQRHPNLESEIRELFPTLLIVENLAPEHDVSVAGEDVKSLKTPPMVDSLGDFRILREVGRGGMGIVYEAEQVSLGRRVALKVLMHQGLSDSKQRIRFQREARSAAKLHHTNIVPVFGVGEDEGMSYYAMQLIQGVGLDELLTEIRKLKNSNSATQEGQASEENVASEHTFDFDKSQLAQTIVVGEFGRAENVANILANGNGESAANRAANPSADKTGSPANDSQTSVEFSPSDSSSIVQAGLKITGPGSSAERHRTGQYWDSVARIGLQVGEALQYAHEHSILHRDIKPHNLILDASGTVWVTDFGLAKALDQQDLTNTGDILGTLRYMPPEAFKSQADQRSDIYSLGITLYELLALRPAFDETDRHRLLSAVAEHSPKRLEQIDPEIPRDLATIVHKSIERVPAHRYQSAQELADDLERFLNDEPIRARRVSSIERLSRWARRNRAMTAALASIATLLLLGTIASLAFAVYFQQQQQHALELQDLAEDAQADAEVDQENAEYSRFQSDIFTVRFLLQKRSMAMAQRILKNIDPKYRNWEWAYLANQAWLRRSPATTDAKPFQGETNTIANFWRNKSAIEFRRIVEDEGGIPEAAFSTNGTTVIVSSQNGSLGLYSIATGEILYRFRHPDPMAARSYGALNPSGTRLIISAATGWPLVMDVPEESREASSENSGAVVGNDRETAHPQLSARRFLNQESSSLPMGMDWVWSPESNDNPSRPNFVVSSHFDRTVRIWNIDTMEFAGTLPQFDREVRDVSFDGSGDVLWTATVGGIVQSWEFPSCKLIKTWSFEMPDDLSVDDVTFHVVSPDRRSAVIMFRGGRSYLWNLETSKQTALPTAEGSSPASSNNRRRAAVYGSDGSCVAMMIDRLEVAIFDTATGQPICQFRGHTSAVRSVRFSPNGKQVLTTGEDGMATIWTAGEDVAWKFDSTETKVVPSLKESVTMDTAHNDAIYQIDLDESGRRLLTGSYDHLVRVWDLKTRTCKQVYKGHQARVLAVDFHPNGNTVASVDAEGELHVWNTATAEQIFAIKPEASHFPEHLKDTGGGWHGEILNFPAVLSTGIFSPDGSMVVSFQNDTMNVFDATDGKLKVSLEGALDHGWPVFSHDSQLVSIIEMDSDQLRVWDTQTGKVIASLTGNDSYKCMVSFSPVDDRMVIGFMAGTLIWNPRTGEPIKFQGGNGYTSSCRFTPDGNYVLTGSGDNQCRIWDSHTGELLTELLGHTGRIRDIRLSPDETRIVSWATDEEVIVWDWNRDRRVVSPLVTLTGPSRPLQVQWSSSGRDLITAWSGGELQIWSGATRQDLLGFDGFGDTFDANGFNQWRERIIDLDKPDLN